MRTIPRNRKEVTAIRDRATVCKVHTRAQDYVATPCELGAAWKELFARNDAKLIEHTDDQGIPTKWTISVNDARWYVLTVEH